MINLAGNALKFTAAGGRVTMETACADDGGQTVVVRDSGRGMTAEDIARSHLAFGSSDSAVRDDRAGAGLGLPLSRAFAQLHGGTLVIESRLGEGTAVTVRFPPGRTLSRPREASAG